MTKKTRKITFSAFMAALTLVFLYLASVFPTGQLGFIAVASLFSVAAVIECGISYAILVYLCCGLLSLLIIPMKSVAIIYLLFFGYYPVIKSLAERAGRKIGGWIFKIAVFFAALSALWFLFKSVIFTGSITDFSPFIIYPAGVVVFTAYDIGLTKLIGYYISRISSKFKNK